MSSRRSVVALISVGAAAALALSGCASNSGDEGSEPDRLGQQQRRCANEDFAKLVPAGHQVARQARSSASTSPYAPNEYKQSGKVVGFDVDLLDAIAKVLGLKTDYREADFDKIVPAVQAGTYDMGMSSFTDTKEREQTVDFVDLLHRRASCGRRRRATTSTRTTPAA